MKFASYFDKKSYIVDPGTVNDMESLTDQSYKSMCEIEQLLIDYRGTPRTPVYDMENYDTSTWTFEDWQNEKAMLERKFLHLSEDAKRMFKTPQEFFKYCSNPENYKLTKDGVIDKPIPDTPIVIPELDPPVPTPTEK